MGRRRRVLAPQRGEQAGGRPQPHLHQLVVAVRGNGLRHASRRGRALQIVQQVAQLAQPMIGRGRLPDDWRRRLGTRLWTGTLRHGGVSRSCVVWRTDRQPSATGCRWTWRDCLCTEGAGPPDTPIRQKKPRSREDFGQNGHGLRRHRTAGQLCGPRSRGASTTPCVHRRQRCAISASLAFRSFRTVARNDRSPRPVRPRRIVVRSLPARWRFAILTSRNSNRAAA